MLKSCLKSFGKWKLAATNVKNRHLRPHTHTQNVSRNNWRKIRLKPPESYLSFEKISKVQKWQNSGAFNGEFWLIWLFFLQNWSPYTLRKMYVEYERKRRLNLAEIYVSSGKFQSKFATSFNCENMKNRFIYPKGLRAFIFLIQFSRQVYALPKGSSNWFTHTSAKQ